jgi:hypothetical protein
VLSLLMKLRQLVQSPSLVGEELLRDLEEKRTDRVERLFITAGSAGASADLVAGRGGAKKTISPAQLGAFQQRRQDICVLCGSDFREAGEEDVPVLTPCGHQFHMRRRKIGQI